MDSSVLSIAILCDRISLLQRSEHFHISRNCPHAKAMAMVEMKSKDNCLAARSISALEIITTGSAIESLNAEMLFWSKASASMTGML